MNPGPHNMTWFRNKKGFSLIEILIAMCLLGIAMLGLATLQARGIRGNDLGNRTSQAIALAQDKLEELINDYATDEDRDEGVLVVGTESSIGTDGIFTRVSSIQTDTPVIDSHTIDVRVTWNDLIGQHRVTETGVITANGY
jgi:prepilin-type N-terminal cleavage/methylation domain-containing protein